MGHGSGGRRCCSLDKLDALEQAHDLEEAQDLDDAQDALATAHWDPGVGDITLLQSTDLLERAATGFLCWAILSFPDFEIILKMEGQTYCRDRRSSNTSFNPFI